MTGSQSLIVHGRHLAGGELKRFAEDKLSDPDTPSWEKNVFRFILVWLDDSDTILQYSSGTTGKSKKLQLLKTAMTRSAENTCRYFGLTAGQTAALCLPMDYIAGKMMVVRCLIAGLELKITEPNSAPDLSATGPVDFCAMVPLQAYNLFKNKNILRVKKLLIGGAEITPNLVSLVSNAAAEVYASYGMAETCSHVALRRLNGSFAQEDYHALPEVSLKRDERGCLVIETPYLPHSIITNDMVRFTGPGSFVWLGRHDNLINSGGIKVVPEELEAEIQKKTGSECAIIGLPDVRLGQRLILVVEKGEIQAKAPDFRAELQKLLPQPLLIKEVILVEKLPKNAVLKLDRKKLADMVYPLL